MEGLRITGPQPSWHAVAPLARRWFLLVGLIHQRSLFFERQSLRLV